MINLDNLERIVELANQAVTERDYEALGKLAAILLRRYAVDAQQATSSTLASEEMLQANQMLQQLTHVMSRRYSS